MVQFKVRAGCGQIAIVHKMTTLDKHKLASIEIESRTFASLGRFTFLWAN